jgi:hypothetical protein
MTAISDLPRAHCRTSGHPLFACVDRDGKMVGPQIFPDDRHDQQSRLRKCACLASTDNHDEQDHFCGSLRGTEPWTRTQIPLNGMPPTQPSVL